MLLKTLFSSSVNSNPLFWLAAKGSFFNSCQNCRSTVAWPRMRLRVFQDMSLSFLVVWQAYTTHIDNISTFFSHFFAFFSSGQEHCWGAVPRAHQAKQRRLIACDESESIGTNW